MLYPRLAFCAVSAVLLQWESVHAAPVPPDAGQTLRELQPPPMPDAPREIPPLTLEDRGESNPASDIRFMIRSVQITGNSKIPTPVLSALVANVVGAEHSLTELRAAVARITGVEGEIAFAVGRGELDRFDVVLRVIEEQVGLKLAKTDRIGLESENAAEHAALVCGQCIEAPVRTNV